MSIVAGLSRDSILQPGHKLNLRPMRHPKFYEAYLKGIRNSWTVDEVDFSQDLDDLKLRLSPQEKHLISRLVAFFATGDEIVSNNLVLNLYRHLNSPELRLYLSRQLFEEAVHVQFYLTLLDAYLEKPDEREAAFRAVEEIPSIQRKASFCNKWLGSLVHLEEIRSVDDARSFVLNQTCFATCIEGLFFFAAFAYVYLLRSRGLFPGLATGTNWVFRDESQHIEVALLSLSTLRQSDPHLFDASYETSVRAMIREAVDCELLFAQDLLGEGISGMSVEQMKDFLGYVADLRLSSLGLAPEFNTKNPFSFMTLQDLQEQANFFERQVSAYQVGLGGKVKIGGDF